jgi:8-oxo-dGTP diphosphatase
LKGKAYSGQWEFPGGKIEVGESPSMAIDRELKEELGINVKSKSYRVQYFYLYPGLYVHLFVWDINFYTGLVAPMEGQEINWLDSQSIVGIDYLAGDHKILNLIS